MFLHDKEMIIVGPVRVGKWHALAEAIREGCKAAPNQAFGVASDHQMRSACALGAARLGGWKKGDIYGDIPLDDFIACPAGCDEPFICLTSAIVHLNDNLMHRWTREAIADWLDTL